MSTFSTTAHNGAAGTGPFAGFTFDESFGELLQMGFEPLPPWEPQIHVVTGRLCRDLLPDGADSLRQRLISGHAFDLQNALDSAIGEALERLCGGFSHYGEAGRKVQDLPPISLANLPRFSTAEVEHLGPRYSLPEDSATICCAPATCLRSQKQFRVPAQLVYCPYHPGPRETFFWEPTTTGLAAGRSSAAADTSGLLEVIERDALAASWLLKIPGQELSLEEALAGDYLAIHHALYRGCVHVRLALVTLDIPVPVCVAAIYDESSRPHVSFGSGAAGDVQGAAKRALCEAAFTRYTLKLGLAVCGSPTSDPFASDPTTFQQHGLAWADKDAASFSCWLFGSRESSVIPLNGSDLTASPMLNNLVDVVWEAGYVAYSVDLVTPEIEGAGWAVRRVLVPGLQPLNPGRNRNMMDSPRLRQVQRLYGNIMCPGIGKAIHPFC